MWETEFSIRPGAKKMAEAFMRAAKELKDWRPAWLEVLPFLVEGVRQNILSEGANIGMPWQPLSEPWASQRGGKAMLILSGALLASIKPLSTSRSKVQVGSKEVYARVHQFGWEARNIPARPFMLFTNQMEARTIDAAAKHADRIMERTIMAARGEDK